MVLKVKVKEIDTSSLGSGGRIVELKNSYDDTILTPHRPASNTEFTAKSYLGFLDPLNNELGAIHIDLPPLKFAKFMKGNGTVKNTKQKLVKLSDLSCLSENFTILDIPSIDPLNQRAQKLLLEMQLRIRTLKSISIPRIKTSNINQFERTISSWKLDAEQYNKGIVPQIRMNEDLKNFKKKLDVLVKMSETEEVSIINLKYANPDNYPHQYTYLWELREADLLFHCSNVPRKGTQISPHFLETKFMQIQRYGIDTISPDIRTPDRKFVASLLFQSPPSTKDEVQYDWTHHPAAVNMEGETWKNHSSGDLECKCPICNRRDQDSIFEKYAYNIDGVLDNSSMRYASNLHNALSLNEEYIRMMDYISSNDMMTYFDEISDLRKKSFYY